MPFGPDLTPYDPYNTTAERVLFPEYLTCEDRTVEIAAHIVQWLTNDSLRSERVAELAELKARIGHGGASRRAADYILKTIDHPVAPLPPPHFRPGMIVQSSGGWSGKARRPRAEDLRRSRAGPSQPLRESPVTCYDRGSLLRLEIQAAASAPRMPPGIRSFPPRRTLAPLFFLWPSISPKPGSSACRRNSRPLRLFESPAVAGGRPLLALAHRPPRAAAIARANSGPVHRNRRPGLGVSAG